MSGNTIARWGGRLVLALLLLGWVVAAAPARADEPAQELTEEERGKLEKEALELNGKGFRMFEDGQYAAATELMEKALAMRRRLYPLDKYPDGHPNLAQSLNNLGIQFGMRGEYGKAEPYIRDALAMYQRLYPADKFPAGHRDLANGLNTLGHLLEARGEYGKAEPYIRDALGMYKRLYPPDKYPDGHPYLALSLCSLGVLAQERGEYGKAEPFFRDALDMTKRLYPPDKYPDGHPYLALSLSSLGNLLRDRGEYGKAEPFLRDALDMTKRLYPPDKYPDGHPNLANSLSSMGDLLQRRGEYGKAEPFLRDALDMTKRLYPPNKYPDGHPKLAGSLKSMGELLLDRGEYGKAEPFLRDALDVTKRLYPPDKYPDGHPDLANSLNSMGELLKSQGEYGKAEPFLRDALDMTKRLYPPDKYPDGHPNLAQNLNNLGKLLRERGEYGKAEPFFRDALDMTKRLYPADKFPDGHPELAESLIRMGDLLRDRGEYGKAEPFLRDALGMCKHLYPPDKYPDGHPNLAGSLISMGVVAQERGEYGKAEPFLRDALDVTKRLYPPDKYPEGHPDLAISLNSMGELLWAQGEYGKAEPFFRDTLDMTKLLYPVDKYPDGHPELANRLNSMGVLLAERGEYGKAADLLSRAAAMFDRLTAAFAESGTEAESLNLNASLPNSRLSFLAVARHMEGADPANQYPMLWQGKSALARGLQRRRRLLRAAGEADPATRRKVEALVAVRQDLARLILAPARPGGDDRAQLLKDLSDQRERLEKTLAGLLPASDRETPPYTDLANRLPDQAVFADLYGYRDLDAKTSKFDQGHYAAFVVRKGQPVRRVELTDADTIKKDLAEWRDDIAKGLRSDAAGRLRKSIWEPIAKGLGDNVNTVYICPDGELSALPWAALPGKVDGHVLLEDYTFAVVPSGPFLLEQLTQPAPTDRDAGVLLAVGGVRYDRDDKVGKPWVERPAMNTERAAVVARSRLLPRPPEVIDRTGLDADVAHLLEDLPKVRWAHLATHGFFAAPESQEREHLFRPRDFLLGVGRERRGAAARNPLTLSGLVLAGANQPSENDSGILTGEAVAGLNMDGMDLAVLSACQTGLGEAATGEGVFGLQRAFHIGGAKNVVASLWTVDDDGAAALMNLFYQHLWGKGEPPLAALHNAELELYRNPEAIPVLAKGSRSPDWKHTIQVVTAPPPDPKAAPKRPAAVKDWAAFVLSGAGR